MVVLLGDIRQPRLTQISWRSSSPGELHPEALTEPCLSLSAHTALAIQKRADALSATTEQFLLLPVDHTDRGVNGLSPSLHGHYPASSLLRDSPSLSSAFVLLPSWFVHLWRLR